MHFPGYRMWWEYVRITSNTNCLSVCGVHRIEKQHLLYCHIVLKNSICCIATLGPQAHSATVFCFGISTGYPQPFCTVLTLKSALNFKLCIHLTTFSIYTTPVLIPFCPVIVQSAVVLFLSTTQFHLGHKVLNEIWLKDMQYMGCASESETAGPMWR